MFSVLKWKESWKVIFTFISTIKQALNCLALLEKKNLNAIKEPEKKNCKQIHKVFNYKWLSTKKALKYIADSTRTIQKFH